MSDADHAPDCALVAYAGMPTQQPLRCDCEASDPDLVSVQHDAEPAAESTSGPVVTLTGGAARAFNEYQRVARENRKREQALLAKLTEELTK